MTIRGKAAIVGIGEVPTRRTYTGRGMLSLLAEAARMAIVDAGLRKEEIDGLITEGGTVYPSAVGEYMQIYPTYAAGVSMMGASSAVGVTTAAAAITNGICNNVLVVMGSAREPGEAFARGPAPASISTEWEQPFGPAAAANTGYGLLYTRHMYEYGTTEEQMARCAVNQRFNAMPNENAVFQGQPITIEDVLNSRYINYPLKLLESVMPCAGAAACVVTSAERAKALPNRPVYILGAGVKVHTYHNWIWDDICLMPTKVSAARAFEMAGYNPNDMQFAEFYD